MLFALSHDLTSSAFMDAYLSHVLEFPKVLYASTMSTPYSSTFAALFFFAVGDASAGAASVTNASFFFARFAFAFALGFFARSTISAVYVASRSLRSMTSKRSTPASSSAFFFSRTDAAAG